MNTQIVRLDHISERGPLVREMGVALLASLFVAVMSQLAIDIHPAPMTMQSFAIFWLSFRLGARRSALALVFYLVEATLGLPVMPDFYINPLWILRPSAGYLVAFPLAAYAVGKLAEHGLPTIWRQIGAVALGNAILFGVGIPWLYCHLGSWSESFIFGGLIFIPGMILKAVLTIGVCRNKPFPR